jgi:hypothetical protein
MTDDHGSAPSGIPGLTQEFVAQLRRIIERMEGVAGLGESLPSLPGLSSLPGVRNLPRPGAISAEQLKSIATTVSAQRRSVEALKAQLTAFDEQLAVLERILVPLADWSKTWAELEERLMNVHRGQGAEGKTGES